MAGISGEQYTIEQAEEDIAALRGQVSIMNEYFSTVTVVSSDVQTTTIEASGAVTAIGGTAASPSQLITDSWNSLGTLTGFTIGVARYRLTTDNCVELDIEVTSGGSNAGTTSFSNSLPSSPVNYIPLVSRHLPLVSTRPVTAADSWPRLFVTSGTGVVQIIVQASISNSFGVNVRVPLN